MSWLWANLDIIHALLIASTTVPFVLFGTAAFWHFGGSVRSGTNLVSVASLLGYVSILYTIWSTDSIYAWSALGIALQSFAVFLFGWCIGTSGKRNLSLAFSENCSPKLMTEGPYAVVRHPFYTSYIIFWLGGFLVAPSIFTALSFLLLVAIYFYASRREDEVLAKLFEGEFAEWHKDTGAFFPKWR